LVHNFTVYTPNRFEGNKMAERWDRIDVANFHRSVERVMVPNKRMERTGERRIGSAAGR